MWNTCRMWIVTLGALGFGLGCSGGGDLMRVTKQDGSAIVGHLVDARADAVILEDTEGRTITIKREDITSMTAITSADADALTADRSAKDPAGEEDRAEGGSSGSERGIDNRESVADVDTGKNDGGRATTSEGSERPRIGRGGQDGVGVTKGAGTVTRDTGTGSRTTSDKVDSTPATPEYRTVTLPAGTALSLVLENTVASDTSHVEDSVRAHVQRAVVLGGHSVVPSGSIVLGSVLAAERSGRVEGRANVSFRFHTLELGNASYAIRTAALTRQARGTKKSDTKKIGIGAAGGAIIGGIIGGKKGAGVGTATGAAAGTGVVLATRGEEVRLDPGTLVTARLSEPVTISVPTNARLPM